MEEMAFHAAASARAAEKTPMLLPGTRRDRATRIGSRSRSVPVLEIPAEQEPSCPAVNNAEFRKHAQAPVTHIGFHLLCVDQLS